MIQHNTESLIIDLDALTGRLNNDKDFMYELLSDFVEDVQSKLGEIKMLLIEGNLNEIAIIAHTIKGTASYLNVHFMKEAACQLEIAVKRNDFKMANIYFRVIENEYEKLADYLNVKKVI